MANIIPSGIDAITGQNRPLESTDTLTDTSGTSVSSNSLPTRFIQGLQAEYASTTSVTVRPGSCRNIADDGNITLATKTTASLSTKHLPGTGFAQINGLDEKGLDNLVSGSITCSQTASTTIVTTGDITPHLGTRSITGTISASTLALTGIGTLFTEELSVGDLVGSSTTYGWSLVRSIESDIAATIHVAFPGGDPSGIAATVIHSPTIQPAAGICERPLTINAAGTSIVVTTNTTHAASSALTIGGIFNGTNLLSHWLAIWVIDNGTTPALLISTQHEDLLAIPAGYTSARRVGWTLYGDYDTGGEVHAALYYEDGGAHRFVRFGNNSDSIELVPGFNNFTDDSWVEKDLGIRYDSGGQLVGANMPRTSRCIRLAVQYLTANATVGTYTGSFRVRGESTSVGHAVISIRATATNQEEDVVVDVATDYAQVLESKNAVPGAGAGAATIFGNPIGFFDDL
jgi:hypothetical protein